MKIKRLLSAFLLAAVVVTSVEITVALAANNKVRIEEVDYDAEDRELTVEFRENVSWKRSAKVIVKTVAGKKVSSYIISKDNDDVKIRVKLKFGKKYKVIVKGVRKGYKGKYGKVVKTFHQDIPTTS